MDRASVQPTPRSSAAALGHIVCGVDGGRRAMVAVEQAVTLGGGGRLTFVAVTHVVGRGATEQASLGAARAEQALDRARRMARDRGIEAETQLVHASDAAEALMKRAAGADLLAIGAPLHQRVGGIVEGATSARVLHRATMPVLIARSADVDTPFPQRILLATDGSGGSDPATELAIALALDHGAQITMLHAGDSGDVERRRMRRAVGGGRQGDARRARVDRADHVAGRGDLRRGAMDARVPGRRRRARRQRPARPGQRERARGSPGAVLGARGPWLRRPSPRRPSAAARCWPSRRRSW